jgi:3',5'-cyclic AMP phosphodiesterase CpdA
MELSRLATWPPPRLTPWEQIRRDPVIFLASWLHRRRPSLAALPPTSTDVHNPIAIVSISDTHRSQPEVPDGDLLLHAGDLTNHGTFAELQEQLDWLASLPHRHKVVIGGNHDSLLDPGYVARFPDRSYETEGRTGADLNWHDLIYLNNTSVTLEFHGGSRKLSIFGSPWTRQYGSFAFQYPTTRDVWTNSIPSGTDVLLTHGPPKGFLDLGGKGCPYLAREVSRARPRLVVFGHIHAGRGQEEVGYRGIERCYQKGMGGDGGVLLIPTMLLWFLFAWFQSLVAAVSGYSFHEGRSRTVMVNSAVVGGFKNERSLPGTTVVV